MVNLEFSKQSLQEQIQKTLQTWGGAIVSQDVRGLMDLYEHNAQLKPTLSKHIRRNREEILSYFIGGKGFKDVGFFQQEITKIEFLESHPQAYESLVIDVGKYKFIKKNGRVFHASYTFVFQNIEGTLKIIAHHSSLI